MTFSTAGRYGPEALIDTSGTPLPLQSCTVTTSPGGVAATIYTSKTKVTTTSNIVLTDGSGNLSFFADPGDYTITTVVNGDVSTLSVTVPIDPGEAAQDSDMVFNVKTMYGAVGDGVANDATAIQSAITAAGVSGGVIFFPKGTYKFNTSLSIVAGTTGLTFLGAGRATTTLVYGGTGSTDAFTVGQTGTPIRRITFRDFKLSGNGASSRYGVFTGNSSEFTYERVWFYNHGSSAVRIDGTFSSNAGSFVHNFRDCYFQGNLADSIHLIQANSVLVEGCYFSNNTGNGLYADICQGSAVIRSTFESMPTGIQLGDTDGTNLGWAVVGCYFENNNYGMTVGTGAGSNNMQGLKISGCEFYGANFVGGRSILLGRAQGVSIENNFFYNPTAEAGTYGHVGMSANSQLTLTANSVNTTGNHVLLDTSPAGSWILIPSSGPLNILPGQASVPGITFFGSTYGIGMDASDLVLFTDSAQGVSVRSTSVAGSRVFRARSNGTNQLGIGAVNTTATDGFPYIPSCAGTPTGVPTTIAGMVPMVYDSTNHKLYIYDGGWKTTTVFS